MILLDTHILVWWLDQQSAKISTAQVAAIQHANAVAISAISLWEIAKLVENNRLAFNRPVLDWITDALTHPKIQIVPLSPEIIVLSTQLPGVFHKDPADQLIVATSLHLGIPLLTKDAKILSYPHSSTVA